MNTAEPGRPRIRKTQRTVFGFIRVHPCSSVAIPVFAFSGSAVHWQVILSQLLSQRFRDRADIPGARVLGPVHRGFHFRGSKRTSTSVLTLTGWPPWTGG